MKGMFISLMLLLLSIIEINSSANNYIQVITVIYISLYVILNRKRLDYFL
ncbi:MAG: hypothetical protein ACRC0G_01625 [Fusobacteriaceae bacterium]